MIDSGSAEIILRFEKEIRRKLVDKFQVQALFVSIASLNKVMKKILQYFLKICDCIGNSIYSIESLELIESYLR